MRQHIMLPDPINDSSAFGTDHREDGAFAVETMGDPAAARNLRGAWMIWPSASFTRYHRRLDRIDVEII